MRPFLVALCVSAALPLAARAADLQHFEDAALHAVWFVDRDEGWAAGDEGAVWHTIDGGATWERQPTGVRASLRSLHFLNPYVGWVAGREELPGGAGSAGILLYTQDGGLNWQVSKPLPNPAQLLMISTRFLVRPLPALQRWKPLLHLVLAITTGQKVTPINQPQMRICQICKVKVLSQ